jgi:hypothetical protein
VVFYDHSGFFCQKRGKIERGEQVEKNKRFDNVFAVCTDILDNLRRKGARKKLEQCRI